MTKTVNLTPRDKIFLLAGAICVIIYILYVFVVAPVQARQKTADQQIKAKIEFIEKYNQLLNRGDYYRQKEKNNKELQAKLAQLFLDSDKPPLAAASLQKILEEIAAKNGVAIVSARVDKPRYVNRLLAIPVEITIASTLKTLSQVLNQIENHEKLMIVEELSIKKSGPKSEPEELKTRILVTGFIRQLEPEKPKKA